MTFEFQKKSKETSEKERKERRRQRALDLLDAKNRQLEVYLEKCIKTRDAWKKRLDQVRLSAARK